MRRYALALALVVASSCASSETEKAAESKCTSSTENTSYECIASEALVLAQTDGLRSAESHLRAWLSDKPHLAAAWCHSLMHDLGHWWIEQGRDATDIFESPYSCAGGLLHGAWSALGQTGGDIDELYRACSSLSRENPDVMVWDCWHGVGHAEGAALDDVGFIETTCKGVPPVWFEACVSGVYSAVGGRMVDGSDHGGLHSPLERDTDWCNGTAGIFYSSCWERQGIMSVRAPEFGCPDSGLGGRQCAYGQGRGQGQILNEGGVWDRDWISNTNNSCRSSVFPDRCFDGVVYETVLHGEGRAAEDVCVLLDVNLGQCLRESGSRRSFELQKPTEWSIA